MAEILTAAPAANLICKKDILVKGDDVTIVDKFIKVAHGPDALEDNRARENARENIRKKLALEAERCTEKTDSCDLQICFMNEFASDEDDGSDCRERNGSAEGPALAALEIASSNISKRMSQIIVPIVPHCPAGESGHSPARPLTPAALFQAEVSRLQAAARVGLERARQPPGQEEQLNSVASRVNLNQRLFSLVGLPPTAKASSAHPTDNPPSGYSLFRSIQPNLLIRSLGDFLKWHNGP